MYGRCFWQTLYIWCVKYRVCIVDIIKKVFDVARFSSSSSSSYRARLVSEPGFCSRVLHALPTTRVAVRIGIWSMIKKD